MKALWAARWVRWLWLAFSLGMASLTAVPTLRLPGYELSGLLALVLTFLGWPVGIALGRREAAGERRAVPAMLAAWASLAGFLVIPLVVAAGAARLTTPCSVFSAVEWAPLLPGFGCLLVAACGVWVGVVTRRWWSATLLCVGVLVVSAVHTAWPLLAGPQAYAFNHFAGYVPGPLYDEELVLTAPVLWFRLETMLLVSLVTLGSSRRLGSRGTLVPMLSTLAGVLALEGNGPSLGLYMTHSALEERLGGSLTRGPLALHYSLAIPPAEVARFADDLEFRYAQVTTFLEAEREPLRVYLYRSPEEKKHLVGAATTQFAKPWLREVHVNTAGIPHPVIKHELVHAIAESWAPGLFGVTSNALLPNPAIIEGLAVAADNPVDDLTLHEWAAAMKKKKLLPEVSALMGSQGFYAAAASRAYATAGSFLRWLVETRGTAKLKALYRDGDFEGAYGESLPALEAAYLAFLDTVPLDERAVNQAFTRFRQGSLFERPCAREVAHLEHREETLSKIEPLKALELNQKCRELQPQEPEHVIFRAQHLLKLGREEEAAGLLVELKPKLAEGDSELAEVLLLQVSMAARRGDTEGQRALLTALQQLHASPSMDRTAALRLAALDLPPSSRAAIDYYFGENPEQAISVHLSEALAVDPGNPLLEYLLGRWLALAHDDATALPHLLRVVQSQTHPLIRLEAARLATECAAQVHRCDQIPDGTEFGSTFVKRQTDWRERCAFVPQGAGVPSAPTK